eukprot:8641069-Karenia_brevis.AAC.1
MSGTKEKGKWTCANNRCRKKKPHSEYSIVIAQYGQKVHGRSRQCNDCVQRRKRELDEQAARTASQVQKKARH